MNDSFRTNVFVRFNPETIASACIYLASRQLQVTNVLLCTSQWNPLILPWIAVFQFCMVFPKDFYFPLRSHIYYRNDAVAK